MTRYCTHYWLQMARQITFPWHAMGTATQAKSPSALLRVHLYFPLPRSHATQGRFVPWTNGRHATIQWHSTYR